MPHPARALDLFHGRAQKRNAGGSFCCEIAPVPHLLAHCNEQSLGVDSGDRPQEQKR